MKFRNLLRAVSVFALLSLASMSAFAETDASTSPVVFVKGLLMLQLQQKDGLQIILPEADGHKATITFVMNDGSRQVIPFKGLSSIRNLQAETSQAVVQVPELVRLKELFGDGAKARVDNVPNKVFISWSSIQSMTTEEVSPYRYTFVRKDTGSEIETFRPRNIAETIRIQLTSSGQLDFKALKRDIDVRKVKEIWVEQVPERADSASMDMFQEHFHHYLHYVVRPAGQNFDVEPTRLTSAAANATPRLGRAFWRGTGGFCGPLRLD